MGNSYGGTHGTATSAQTIYLPVGTSVTLTANPSSFFNSFGGWSGALTSGASTQQVRVSAPVSVAASFGLDYLAVGGLAAAILMAVLGLALFVRRRGRRKVGTAAQALLTEPLEGDGLRQAGAQHPGLVGPPGVGPGILARGGWPRFAV